MAAAVALLARLASRWLPSTISEVLVAVLLGILVANALPLPAAVSPGVRFAVQRVLRLGIILLGARLSLGAVVAIGGGALGLVVATMAAAFSAALLIGRAAHVPPRLALLIGVGTAVCGNSAIVATAPVVKAEEREVSFAVATITLFGTLAVFAFPLLGLWLGLDDVVFGLWSGIAVNDTSQVVAASSAYSPVARDVATVVKLVRNALMAPLIVLIAWWWHRDGSSGAETVGRSVRTAVPLFVLGFLALASLRSVGAIGAAEAAVLDEVAKVCILVALTAVGLSTRIAQMRAIGPSPFYVGFGTAAVLAGLGLLAIVGLGISPAL